MKNRKLKCINAVVTWPIKAKKIMFVLVPYNISPIQQGIQALHAAVEYGLKYGKTKDYIQWANEDKTVYVMNGGTTNNKDFLSSMQLRKRTLKQEKIKFAEFYEPDLNDALTGLAFIVDELLLRPEYVVRKKMRH